MNQKTLERFEQARAQRDGATAELQSAIENFINSSDLNDRHYMTTLVGSVAALQKARNQAWKEYLEAEDQLIQELNKGMFPGQHRSG